MSIEADLRSALAGLEAVTRLVSADVVGYPVDENKVIAPPSGRLVDAGLVLGDGAGELARLYELCDGVTLPDIHIGYFIDGLDRVKSAAARGEPVNIGGATGRQVLVFGSDGGGGRFALDRASESVLHLASGGAVHNGSYYDRGGMVKVVASSVVGLVRALTAEVQAQVDGTQVPHIA